MEIMVNKNKKEPRKMCFKYFYLDSRYDFIELKRLESKANIQDGILSSAPPKVMRKKFDDFTSLSKGDTSVIRLSECQDFYYNLPYEIYLVKQQFCFVLPSFYHNFNFFGLL